MKQKNIKKTNRDERRHTDRKGDRDRDKRGRKRLKRKI